MRNRAPRYRIATNAAYDLLVTLSSISLAIDVFYIAEKMIDNCRLLTYGQACFLYGLDLSWLLEESEYGFTIIKGGKRIILYNEDMPLSCIRFTIAHEIGHAVLGHANEDDPAAEKEANCFARNLLCPLPVAKELGIDNVSEYVSIFNVSEKMATVSLNFRDSDMYYIQDSYWEAMNDRVYAYMNGYESVGALYAYLAS